jgi:mannose-6-phosphate isomerase-like protein (cupin superfamily)
LEFDWCCPIIDDTRRAMTSDSAREPILVDPLELSAQVTDRYRNVSLGQVNDHEVRLSVMTERFRWHRHPDSDETFLGVEGELVIEFTDHEVVVSPGQLVTVPAGVIHRTRPAGARSVNLTFERLGAETIFEEQALSDGPLA